MLIMWDPENVQVDIRRWHAQYCHTIVQSRAARKTYAIIFMYGELTLGKRKYLWEGLQEIADNIQGPWLALDDFNGLALDDFNGPLC